MNNKFCSNCGTELTVGANFCKGCGAKTDSGQKNPSVSQSYRLLLPASYKKGVFSLKACTLIFSATNIIVSLVNKSLMKEHIASVKTNAKNDGFFKKSAAIMKSGTTYIEKYNSMTPEQIVSEHPESFTISNNSVNQIKFRKETTSYTTDDNYTTNPPSLTIKTSEGKFVFTLNRSSDSHSLIQVVSGLFPGKYKGPIR